MALSARLGAFLYGAFFVVVLPALLALWARALEPVVTLVAPDPGPGAWALVVGGFALVAWGMIALRAFGGGLPMNAYPPPRLVTRGPYAIVAHPIYVGACVACAGVALALRSAAGVWIVTPALALGCVALVSGYEGRDLAARFARHPRRAWIGLPPDDDGRPTLAERTGAVASSVLPWTLAYEIVAALGVPPDAFATYLPFERAWPVAAWAEPVYASAYVAAIVVPFLARRRRTLRAFVANVLLASAIVFPIYLTVPLIAPPRAFDPAAPLAPLLALERALDTPAEAFPSFHAIWAIVCAHALAADGSRGRRAVAWVWSALVCAACVATGMHAILDVVAGVAVGALVVHAGGLWRALLRATERVANSWREWRIGPLRIINHGVYAGVGTASALVVATSLLGPGHDAAVFVACAGALVGAAAWAQIIEGSALLMRPYGFYGGVLGVALASLAAPLFGTSAWLLLGSLSVAGPWVQSWGRVRCLVQGCCHGAPSEERQGIRYNHPRSRVARIAGLAGTPVYPTPLYSILWNVVVVLVETRLWFARAPAAFVVGAYLMLTGFGRFVEESYRGEPQTRIYFRLRVYQWIAVGTVIVGAAFMPLAPDVRPPALAPHAGGFAVALLFGAINALALGVDFPRSNRRFSRLA